VLPVNTNTEKARPLQRIYANAKRRRRAERKSCELQLKRVIEKFTISMCVLFFFLSFPLTILCSFSVNSFSMLARLHMRTHHINKVTKSPLTPGTPAIDLVAHLTNQAERIVAERGIQITLPFRFKHPQPDEVIPYHVVAADGTVKEWRDGEKIVLARRGGGSERVVKGKEIIREDARGRVDR